MNKEMDNETTILYTSHMSIKINLGINKNSCLWSQYNRNGQKIQHIAIQQIMLFVVIQLNLTSNLILTAKQSQAW